MRRHPYLIEELLRPDLGNRRKTQLAAVLYAVGALRLLSTAAFLPPAVDPMRILVLAVVALASAALVLLVPRTPAAALLAWDVALISAIGAWAGGLAHFVGFYGLTAIFAGLTQKPGAWAWIAPLYAGSVTLALLGNEPIHGAPDLVGTALLSLVVVQVLALALHHSQRASQGAATLLEAVSSLQGLATEVDAADAVAGLAHRLLSPDSALVMVAARRGSPMFVNRGQRGVAAPLGSLVVDTGERSGIGLAMQEGRAIFVGEAHQSPLLARAVIARFGFASVLFIPIPGEGGYLGCLVLGWSTAKHQLDPFSEQVISLLSDQAGGLLERLRNVGVLQRQATTDALTGLDNRRTFLDALDRLRPGGAVVFLDLDHFKQLNDTRGHLAGDEVLVAFAAAMRASVRDGDCAARYGGEEFAIVLPSAASVDMGSAAAVVVNRLRQRWTGPVTFSVGIAVHRAGDAPSTTLARADEALYGAKAAGRNTLVVA